MEIRLSNASGWFRKALPGSSFPTAKQDPSDMQRDPGLVYSLVAASYCQLLLFVVVRCCYWLTTGTASCY